MLYSKIDLVSMYSVNTRASVQKHYRNLQILSQVALFDLNL